MATLPPDTQRGGPGQVAASHEHATSPATIPAADLRREATEAARRGWAVFPCRPGDKRPAIDRWEQRATRDPELIVRRWPAGHNVGVACGPSRLVVIDLDAHGELPGDWQVLPGVIDGRDVLACLCEWADQPWPSTHMVATPGGGWHLYFAASPGKPIRNSAGLLGPGVDIRAAGGYVVGAGSVIAGRTYLPLDRDDPAPLPAWLCRLLLPAPAQPGPPTRPGAAGVRLRGLVGTVAAGQPGDRTGPLVWAAHRLAELITAGQASPDDGELLVQAAVAAGIRGGERYARGQVAHVLGGTR